MKAKNKVVPMSPPIKAGEEWLATERSDEAEEALLREYHYHMLRAEELKRFLEHCGLQVEA